QVPAPMQLLAVELEREAAFAIAVARITVRVPAAAIPDHYRTAAILALWDRALEPVVFDRVILNVNRQPFLARPEARRAGHRPPFHHAVEFEPEIVVQAAGRVLLDYKLMPAAAGDPATRLGRDIKFALGAIGLERHARFAFA